MAGAPPPFLEREEPPQGFEPWTYALRKHRSTTELRRRRVRTRRLRLASVAGPTPPPTPNRRFGGPNSIGRTMLFFKRPDSGLCREGCQVLPVELAGQLPDQVAQGV